VSILIVRLIVLVLKKLTHLFYKLILKKDIKFNDLPGCCVRVLCT